MRSRAMWTMGVALALAMPAQAKDQTGAKIFAGVVGVIMLLIPVVVFTLRGRARAKAAAAENWATTTGTVTAVSIRRDRTRKGGSWYRPQIAYRFEVQRQTYTGKRLSFGWTTFKTEAAAAAAIEAYRVDGPITVRYDSNNPADNVINAKAVTTTYTVMAWAFVALDVLFIAVVAAALLK